MTGLSPIKCLPVVFVLLGTAWGDEPKQQADGEGKTTPEFQPSDEVRQALAPLFSSVSEANASRVTVRLSSETLINGALVDSQTSTYQIASSKPNRWTIYLKEPDQRTRIYCNGEEAVVALAPDAYFRLPDAIEMQSAVTNLPVPLGPYPEAALALSLAGVDPAVTFLSDMKSLELVDRGKFRGKIPANHFQGVQADDVSWDLWITQDKAPKPLRLLVDLTPMLRATNSVQLAEGFSYLLRFDFLGWRMAGKVDNKLFEYSPPQDAKQYKSLDDYYQAIAGAVAEHPLLGKPAPAFKGKTLSGQTVSQQRLKGKVVVVDFWATWCVPCASVIPVLKEVTDEYADKGVVLLAVNVGETAEKIEEFIKQQQWQLNVVVDSDTKIASAFSADAIPLTVVIGQNGIVESVHVGFPGEEGLRERLTDELEVLAVGGRIASAQKK